MSKASEKVIREISVERRRQFWVEEHTDEEDDAQELGELGDAAACYAASRHIDYWPWDPEWDKRKKHSRRRRLVIAAALLIAEIERIDRRMR